MMQEMLYLYPGRSRSRPAGGISVGQFSPRDMPDRPDWPNAPLLAREEMDSLLMDVFGAEGGRRVMRESEATYLPGVRTAPVRYQQDAGRPRSAGKPEPLSQTVRQGNRAYSVSPVYRDRRR